MRVIQSSLRIIANGKDKRYVLYCNPGNTDRKKIPKTDRLTYTGSVVQAGHSLFLTASLAKDAPVKKKLQTTDVQRTLAGEKVSPSFYSRGIY